ncbi:glycosyl transferase [Sorochytrium milnesiophthora]
MAREAVRRPAAATAAADSTDNSVTRLCIRAFGIATIFKLLLVPAYRSTDFDVHRNWLAVTHSLPLSKWYYEDTSEWTLDYPPFFAYFEKVLSTVANLYHPQMLQILRDPYISTETVLFQRLTVVATDALLLFATIRFCRSISRKDAQRGCCVAAVALLLFNPGLVLIDHIHFQYNGLLYGLLVWSLAEAYTGNFLASGALFTVLLNFKHIYLYIAPAYFVYLLRAYCLRTGPGAFMRLARLGSIVVAVFAASLLPFAGHLPQLFQRLFPFKRGLYHAYWAPNAWALYAFADRVLIAAARATQTPLKSSSTASATRGVVGDTSFGVLPDVTPLHTLVLTILAQLPTARKFVQAVALCGFASFAFGWHVHEKAILLVTIPLRFFGLGLLDRLYLCGLLALEWFSTVGHRLLLQGRLPFLPLMATSVYCAVGIFWSLARVAREYFMN